jgi:hypothetical protein
MRRTTYRGGLAGEAMARYPACPSMVPASDEELAVLRFLQSQGGLCTTAVWRQCAKGNRINQRALRRLIQRGHILAPQPGQLYILAEPGYRALRVSEKRERRRPRHYAPSKK